MKLFLTALLIACSISLSFSAEGLGDSNRTKELVENLSDSYDFWMSFDNISSIEEIIPIEKRLEDWRIKNGLSKDNMTTLFVQIIQEHLLKLEKACWEYVTVAPHITLDDVEILFTRFDEKQIAKEIEEAEKEKAKQEKLEAKKQKEQEKNAPKEQQLTTTVLTCLFQ